MVAHDWSQKDMVFFKAYLTSTSTPENMIPGNLKRVVTFQSRGPL